MVPKRVKFITFGIKEGKFGLFLKIDFFFVLGKLHGNVVFEPRIKIQRERDRPNIKSFSYSIFISMLAQLPFNGSRTHADTCLWFGGEHLWDKIFYTLKIFIGILIYKANGPTAPTPSMQFELEVAQPLQTVAI